MGRTDSREILALLTTTRDFMEGEIQDQIFDMTPFLSYLNGKLAKGRSQVKKTQNGGAAIIVHLMFEENSTVDSYTGAGVIDTALQEGMTTGQYDWKQYAGTVGITGLEKRNNKGKDAVINLLQAKIDQFIMTMRNRMNIDAFGDGTGNGGKNLTGLEALISDTSTVAGLPPSSNDWWKSTVSSSVGSFSANGISKMTNLYNTLTFGSSRPDFIISTQTIFESFEATFQPLQRFQDVPTANAGFTNLTFKNVPFVWDRDCTSGVLYMLNSDNVNFYVHPDADMTAGPFVEPENQDVMTSKTIWQGNLTTNNRRKLGKMTDIT